MSIISPFPQNTIIRLYKNVPWGRDNKDIRWFSTSAQREVYLNNRYMNQWSNCSIVKMGKAIKLTGQINDYLIANYMQFTNYGAGEESNVKTFYAFITSVDYVNINTFEITYEIDWIQTYLFDFQFGACLVEREHVNDDTPGKWPLEEGMETGEMSVINVSDHTFNKAMRMLSLSTASTHVDLTKVNGMINGVERRSSNYDGDLSYIETALTQLNTNGESNEVVDFCMCAAPMINNVNGMHETFNVSKDGNLHKFGDSAYTAVNNKLGCFPYKFLTVDNYEGSVEQYRYENFADTALTFAVEGTDMPKPCMICFPINYMGWKGSATSPNTFQQMSVPFTNFPQIPWTSDTFRAWVSQHKGTIAANVADKIIKAGVGTALLAGMTIPGVNIAAGSLAASAMGAGLLTSGVTGAASTAEEIQQHKIHGQELQGSVEMAGVSYLRDTIGFRVTQYCLRPDMAKRIDEKLTRYGYTVMDVKVPNITGRQYVNYVKTNGAHVDGNIPIDAKQAMEAAMDSGVSFWHIDDMDTKLISNPIV